jgi:hypothetical protein
VSRWLNDVESSGCDLCRWYIQHRWLGDVQQL